MMKKLLLFIALLFSLSAAKSQVLHVKGVEGTFLEVNHEKAGIGLGIGYYKIQTKKLLWKAMGETHFSTQGNTKTRIYNAFGEVGYTVYSFKQQLFLSVTGGLGMGAESMLDRITDRTKSRFVLMESVGLSVEYCILEQLTATLNFRQRFLQFNNNGVALYQVGIGLQYNFK